MDAELKKLVNDLNTAFTDFKAKNDERMKQIEARGTADAALVNGVEKANSAIADIQAKITEHQAQIRAVETASARVNAGGTEREEQNRTHAAQFFASVRNKPTTASQLTAEDVQTYNAYHTALNAYMRRGEKGLTTDMQAALSVGSDPAGGYWVTPDTTGRMVQLIYESSPMRQIANVQTISTDELEGTNDLGEADSGWVGETGTRNDTDTPTIGKWSIPVHEQYAQPKATQKLLDDASVDVEAWLGRKVADKLSRRENTAFVGGDGIEKPRGFLTYTAGTPSATTWNVIPQTVTGASGAFAASSPGDPLIDVVFGIKAAYRNGAQWVMSRATVGAVRKLKDGDGNYLWQPNFTAQQTATLLGYGITELEDMPVIAANSLSMAFGNWREAYQIVDRIGIRVLRDPFTGKPYVKFYTTKRVGGDVVNFDAIRIVKFST